jgi:hypothetical protein
MKDPKKFYAGPWRKGIIERYGMAPDIEYYTVFCITDNSTGQVRILEKAKSRQTRSARARQNKKAQRLEAAE